MNVGRYWQKKGNYLAAVNRFKTVVSDYQQTAHVEEALMRLTECYMALGIVNEAQTAAAVLDITSRIASGTRTLMPCFSPAARRLARIPARGSARVGRRRSPAWRVDAVSEFRPSGPTDSHAGCPRSTHRHPGQAKREPGSQKWRRFNPLRSRVRLRLSGKTVA